MTYRELSALPPEAYLDPEKFRTDWDNFPENAKRGAEQYQEGLRIGREAAHISISVNSVWGAKLKNGADLSSCEGIGYHACTAQLLRGFLDSGARIVVYRLRDGKIETTVIREGN